MKIVVLAMIGLFLAVPAMAEELECATIIVELKQRPPASGDQARASADYTRYQVSCGAGLDANDLEALRPMVCQHGGFVDHVNGKLYCH